MPAGAEASRGRQGLIRYAASKAPKRKRLFNNSWAAAGTMRKLIKVLLFIVVFAVLTPLLYNFSLDYSKSAQVRRVANFEPPSSSKLMLEEVHFSSYSGDGISLWVYQLPKGSSKNLLGSDCKSLGYDQNLYEKTGMKPQFPYKEAENADINCFRLRKSGSSTELSLITEDERLIVYVEVR